MSLETVVLLHGFAGSAAHWERVRERLDGERYRPLAIELAHASPQTPAGVLAQIDRLAPRRFVLCGYSLGGRVAIEAALALSGRVSRLVLVSASAGIEDPAERRARHARDEALAQRIERAPIEQFVKQWRQVALFDGDPAWVHEAAAQEERGWDPAALAASLRGLGPGAMPSNWGRLAELTMPVGILAGERDAAYCALARRLAAAIPNSRVQIVAGAGHRLALEAPSAVAQAIAG